MKILLLLLIIFCFTDILGQTISPDKKVVENVRNQKSNIGPKITVQIYDLEDDEPIPFAILALILR